MSIEELNNEQAQELLKVIASYISKSPSYLSESTEFARGYKEGVIQAKNLVKAFFTDVNIPI